MSWSMWLGDLVKQTLVGVILGAPLPRSSCG